MNQPDFWGWRQQLKKCNPRIVKITRQSANVHLFQVLRFQDDYRQFASSWNITQGEADITELVLLYDQHWKHIWWEPMRHQTTFQFTRITCNNSMHLICSSSIEILFEWLYAVLYFITFDFWRSSNNNCFSLPYTYPINQAIPTIVCWLKYKRKFSIQEGGWQNWTCLSNTIAETLHFAATYLSVPR